MKNLNLPPTAATLGLSYANTTSMFDQGARKGAIGAGGDGDGDGGY